MKYGRKPNKQAEVELLFCFQFPRVRGRGWNRGNYPGNNSNGNPANMNPPQRPQEEEWDPEYTPKSRKYYLVSDTADDSRVWGAGVRGVNPPESPCLAIFSTTIVMERKPGSTTEGGAEGPSQHAEDASSIAREAAAAPSGPMTCSRGLRRPSWGTTV